LNDAEYAGQDFSERMNLNSKTVIDAVCERYVADAADGECFQLLRKGYYKKMSGGDKPVLSEIVSLKDSFKA
ncbi:MAG: glutamine--tRNA ligase, partial [Clostridia bacterium]|nr:glutamine--tRNA ligase [Clostridia bacterium]